MSILYTIERHTHGWLICAASGQRGVPMNAVDECMPMFPRHSGGAVFDAGIVHHYDTLNYRQRVVFAVTTPEGSKLWRAEIEAYIARIKHPHDRWWYGVDVGTSSASIFGVLCPSTLCDNWAKEEATRHGNGSTPADADDLGRCLRLIALFPEWRDRLDEVAAAYPGTAWPRIIDRWGELEKADAKTQCYILNECRTPKAGEQ